MDVVQETPRLRLLGGKAVTGHGEFLRAGRAELSHKSRKGLPAQRHAELHLWYGEPGRLRGQSEVAATEQDHRPTYRDSVGHSDRDLGKPVEQLAIPPPEVDPSAPINFINRRFGPPIAYLRTSGERPTGTGEDHHSYRVVRLEVHQDTLQLVM